MPRLPLTPEEREFQLARLTEKRDEYIERLDIGAAKIEEARAQGKDVTSWEDFWVNLLHQYEAVCAKIEDLRQVPNASNQ